MAQTELQDSARLELRQTRAFTTRECRVLYSLWRRLRWPQGASRAYSAATYAWYGFAGFLVFSILRAASRLADTRPDVAAQLMVALLGFVASYALLYWRQAKFTEAYCFETYRPGNRVRLAEDGLRRDIGPSSIRHGWTAITTVHSSESWLVVLMANNGALLLAKAAFAGQDVEAFCAELMHRWHAGCAAAKGAES